VRAGAAASLPLASWRAVLAALDPPPGDAFAGGRRLGVVPFVSEGRTTFRPYGRGLNGRQWLDLATLSPDTLVTPNDRFYIRTRCPESLDTRRPWSVRVGGGAAAGAAWTIDELRDRSRPMGVHLLECSGNGGCFGLMSAAAWSGVPLADMLATVDRPAGAAATDRVRVTGFDEHEGVDPRSKEAGASWIFTREQLAGTGGFLATGMNGEPLPRDHGAPVRLVVPGWYGCTCIKWVEAIDFVPDDARATKHMREFAGRTQQRGVPRHARSFRPAEIDLAAMPVRVERWRVGGRTVYRVVGIIWGGGRTTDALVVRFGRDARFVPVDELDHRTNDTWTLWTHAWRPRRPGRYRIALRVDDATIRTRRLDRGFYTRAVRITEV
jgi:DMSO/TMAO reductase YedYZ molybdopterin-dependent catalytic subunit